MDETTQYGFTWGAMDVARMATFTRPGGDTNVVGISTGYHRVQVYVSPTGRSVRVYMDGKELKRNGQPAD